jgi:hypothetical protein
MAVMINIECIMIASEAAPIPTADATLNSPANKTNIVMLPC